MKVNHALVLGGAQGIGKDTVLEPFKYAVPRTTYGDTRQSKMKGKIAWPGSG